MGAFDYADSAHQRRHGPIYASRPPYRDWLRDEFAFRCVYCLIREQWTRRAAEFDIEHWIAQANDPAREFDYDNLFYACHVCNSMKGTNLIPDPGRFLTKGNVEVNPIDGSLRTESRTAALIIEKLELDSEVYRDWRLMWMRIVELAEQLDSQHFLRLMGFPDELPDLSRRRRRPPKNTRPEGIENSYFAQRQRSELPHTY